MRSRFICSFSLSQNFFMAWEVFEYIFRKVDGVLSVERIHRLSQYYKMQKTIFLNLWYKIITPAFLLDLESVWFISSSNAFLTNGFSNTLKFWFVFKAGSLKRGSVELRNFLSVLNSMNRGLSLLGLIKDTANVGKPRRKTSQLYLVWIPKSFSNSRFDIKSDHWLH